MGKWTRRLVFAFQFLTRIPIKANLELESDDFSRSSRFFPLVSLAVGLIGLLPGAIGLLLVGPALGVALAMLGEIFLTGALHLDGMGDTLDALGSSRNRERMLEIMKDSRMGTMGVVAIVFDLGLRFVLLSALLEAFGPLTAAAAYVSMQAAGRVCVSAGGAVSQSARKDGMGKPFIDGMNWTDLIVALLLSCAIAAGLTALLGAWTPVAGASAAAAVLLLTIPFGMLTANRIGKVFGGITGDTLGFLYEVGELFYLFALFVAGWFFL